MDIGRTRAKIRNKLAKINENESENTTSSSDALHKEGIGLSEGSYKIHGMQGKEDETKDEEPVHVDFSNRKEAVECPDKVHLIEMDHENDTKESIQAEGFGNKNDDEKKDTSQKLEVVDPLQAMLFDMIPTLGVNKANEISKYVTQSEEPQLDPGVEPVKKKKKKVSYKDVAGELLKDW